MTMNMYPFMMSQDRIAFHLITWGLRVVFHLKALELLVTMAVPRYHDPPNNLDILVWIQF